MSVWATGDTHGKIDIQKLGNKHWKEQKDLTKDDYLIIAGDWGVIWTKEDRDEKYFLEFYNDRNFTTLIVNGNHDNIPRLNSFPEINMFGDKVRQISTSVFYLQNGHIYTINEHTFFIMGGALSIDKYRRIEGRDWWPEEIPDYATWKLGFDNLENLGNCVDFIVTHASHSDLVKQLYYIDESKLTDPVVKNLDIVKERVKYEKWICAHYHQDKYFVDIRTHLLYNTIIKLC